MAGVNINLMVRMLRGNSQLMHIITVGPEPLRSHKEAPMIEYQQCLQHR